MDSSPAGLENSRSALLPTGVRLTSLETYVDDRGDFTEFFRKEWHESPQPVQWNISRSGANVLRGVHVHALHWDYLCVVAGEVVVGLHDLRPGASAAGRSAMLKMNESRLQMLVIPPGVAHGFYSVNLSMYVIGASGYYDPTDHRRCRWDCPELALDWPCTAPELSPADRNAPGHAELRATFLAAMTALRSQA